MNHFSYYLPFILGLLPSLAWLIFYLEEDPHPEPKKLIFYTFIMGAFSTLIVFGIQTFFAGWLEIYNINRYGVFSTFVLAGIEELFKFGAAYLIISYHRKDFDEPVDAMIYMVIAALGFSAVENIGAISTSNLPIIEVASLRFIGATLLHTISSGLVGYYWARSIIVSKKNLKRNLMFKGFIFAILLHTVFNLLIINIESPTPPVLILVFYALFVLYGFERLKYLKS